MAMEKPKMNTESVHKKLSEAIREGTFSEQGYLIAKYPGVLTYRMFCSRTLLSAACIKEDLDTAKKIIAATKKYRKNELERIVNAKDRHRARAIHSAVLSENFELIKLLIENGAQLNVLSRNGRTPLLNAIRKDIKGLAIVTLLLTHSADPNLANLKDETPLHCAVQRKDFSKARLLTKFGANITIKNEAGDTPLKIAINKKDIAIISLFLTYLAESNTLSKENIATDHVELRLAYTLVMQHYPALTHFSDKLAFLFHLAVKFGIRERVEYFLKNPHIDINAKDKEGHTPLEIATSKKDIAIISLLLPYFAGQNIENEKTIEAYTLVMEHYDTLSYIQNTFEFLLHLIVRSGCPEKIECCLKNAYMNIHVQDSKGRTPLHVALIKKKQAITKEPLVVIENHQKIVDLLIAYSCADTLNTQDLNGQTPLHLAVNQNDLGVVKYLLNKGASVNLVNNAGYTPFQLAFIKKEKAVNNQQQPEIIHEWEAIVNCLIAYEVHNMFSIQAINDQMPLFFTNQQNDFYSGPNNFEESYSENSYNTWRFM